MPRERAGGWRWGLQACKVRLTARLLSAFLSANPLHPPPHPPSFRVGFVFVEAIVELRGCGVTFAQMTLSSFVVFVPALVGRLAAGVLTQQAKVGTESAPVVPAEWEDSKVEWQRSAFRAAKTLCIDLDFFTTAAGTGVFQHILNAVTFVLLVKGNKSTLFDIGKFLLFGVNNTLASGAMQAVRTLMMRAIFGLAWNMASSQPWETPVFDEAMKSRTK